MHVLFLDPIGQSTTREAELQNAVARSHAAKVAHQRAKSRPKARARWSDSASIYDVVAGRVKTLESDLSENVDLIPVTSIYPGFGSYRSELLDLLPNEARPGDLLALDFFVEVTLPGIDVAIEMFNSSGSFQYLLPNLTTPVSYHAIMALINLSSAMHRQPELKPNMLVLEHRGRAMEKVRAHLQRGDSRLSEALIIAILTLATVEGALGNSKSYELHLSALKLFEQEKGHLKLLSGKRVDDMVALYSDTTFALQTGRSFFKRRRYEAIYLCRPLPVEGRLPLGFAVILQQIPISQDTIAVLTNACNFGLSEPCVTMAHSQKMVLARRRQITRKYHNYLDSVPILLAPDNPDILFEKMLVLALSLFAWCGFNTVRYPQFAMYIAMMRQLLDRLVQYDPETEIERKCAAWMWLMAIDACRIGGSDGTVLSQGRDMLWQFHRRFPGFRSWAKIQKLTTLFFWTADMEQFWSRRWEQFSGEVL